MRRWRPVESRDAAARAESGIRGAGAVQCAQRKSGALAAGATPGPGRGAGEPQLQGS